MPRRTHGPGIREPKSARGGVPVKTIELRLEYDRAAAGVEHSRAYLALVRAGVVGGRLAA